MPNNYRVGSAIPVIVIPVIVIPVIVIPVIVIPVIVIPVIVIPGLVPGTFHGTALVQVPGTSLTPRKPAPAKTGGGGRGPGDDVEGPPCPAIRLLFGVALVS
jgi:hypothetical protein